MGGEQSFRERYGQWAVIAGASEGVGEAFAGESLRESEAVPRAMTRNEAVAAMIRQQETALKP